MQKMKYKSRFQIYIQHDRERNTGDYVTASSQMCLFACACVSYKVISSRHWIIFQGNNLSCPHCYLHRPPAMSIPLILSLTPSLWLIDVPYSFHSAYSINTQFRRGGLRGDTRSYYLHVCVRPSVGVQVQPNERASLWLLACRVQQVKDFPKQLFVKKARRNFGKVGSLTISSMAPLKWSHSFWATPSKYFIKERFLWSVYSSEPKGPDRLQSCSLSTSWGLDAPEILDYNRQKWTHTYCVGNPWHLFLAVLSMVQFEQGSKHRNKNKQFCI